MKEKPEADRLTEVEMQLAHLQRQYDLLNEVVTEQAIQLDRAHKWIVKWELEIDRLKHAAQPSSDLLDEKPPHY